MYRLLAAAAAPSRQQLLFRQAMMVPRPFAFQQPLPVAAFHAPVFSSPLSLLSSAVATGAVSPLLLALEMQTIEATSILRKRRTKMNKHKLQKRRKLDRRRHLR